MVLNATPATSEAAYDRKAELKAFDETKAGVKGLVDAGITNVPRMFHLPSPDQTLKSGGGQHETLTLPTIDFEGINVDPVRRNEVVKQVKDASEHWGFFQIVNHGISMEELEEMRKGVLGFHEQDTEAKKRWYNMNSKASDPVSYNSNFDLYVSPVANWKDTLVCHMVPNPPHPHQVPPICREILMKYSDEVHKLGIRILELMSEALGLDPTHLVEMGCAEGLSLLGLYYPSCPQPELTLGLNSHKDNTFITILQQDQIGALQVFNDNRWIDVPPTLGALVVNVGEFLTLITNDKFASASHRVLANKHGPRVSVASFFRIPTTQYSKIYEPIKELLSKDNPPKYKSMTMREYMDRFMENGINGVSPLLHFRM